MNGRAISPAPQADPRMLFPVVQEVTGLSGLAMKALGARFEPCMCCKAGCIGYRVRFGNAMHVTAATGAEFFNPDVKRAANTEPTPAEAEGEKPERAKISQ